MRYDGGVWCCGRNGSISMRTAYLLCWLCAFAIGWGGLHFSNTHFVSKGLYVVLMLIVMWRLVQ